MPTFDERLHPHLEQLLDGAVPEAIPGLLALIDDARLDEQPSVAASDVAAGVRPSLCCCRRWELDAD